MNVRREERGTALLTVLLLVAVMATVSATAMDRIGVATRIAANGSAAAQGRSWLSAAELLATARIEDLITASPKRTLPRGWLGVSRTIDLPGGGKVKTSVTDGGNCFNLNSLVQVRDRVVLAPSQQGGKQFEALLAALSVPAGEAARIVHGATDYIDDDDLPLAGGVERGGYPADMLPANRMMADKSELRAIPGVTATLYGRVAPWICALPVAEPSKLNVNTLLPEQAPLLAILGIDVAQARMLLAQRPASGFADAQQFWASPALRGVPADEAARGQAGVATQFFNLAIEASNGDVQVQEAALVDARQKPARIISRQWGELL